MGCGTSSGRKSCTSAPFLEKCDMMPTFIFLRFMGEKFKDGVENLVHFYDLFSGNTDFSQMSDHQLQKTEFSTTANAGNTPLPFRILKSNQFAGIKIMFFQFIRKIITYTSLATIVQHKFFGKLCYCCTSFFLVGENRRQCRWFQKVLGMSGKNVLLW